MTETTAPAPSGAAPAPAPSGAAPTPVAAPAAVDAAAYDILRTRLAGRAAELAARAEALNAARTAAFGDTRLELTRTARLHTDRPAVLCDLLPVADGVLLAARNTTPPPGEHATVADVFTLHARDDLSPLPEDTVPGLLDDAAFRREFAALHRYYRDARLVRLRRVDDKLLAVFRTGGRGGAGSGSGPAAGSAEHPDDIRVLRWSLPQTAGRAAGAAFLDARGDRDHVLPPAHDFAWTTAIREDHVPGRHPHVRVQDGLHVSTLGGVLTVKTENDTTTPDGIHSEPLQDPLQSLADAEIAHARVGHLVLLRVRPYNEDTVRCLVYDTLTRTVVRLDAVGQACRRLPNDQGIVFPGGCFLAGTGHRAFQLDLPRMEFEREVRSPNGEDVLYAFHSAATGAGLLLPYNLIRQEIATPVLCRGWALFDDGALLVLRADGDEAARVHPVAVWRSPFVSDTHAAAAAAPADAADPLLRIGNADLVRGVSACLAVARTVTETADAPTPDAYRALAAACRRAADAHHWLTEPELGAPAEPLEQVREAAEQVLAEYETVRLLTARAEEEVAEAEARAASLVRRLRGETPRTALAWVEGLTGLRSRLGRLLGLRDLRYADTGRVDAAAADLTENLESFGRRAVSFLARDDAFTAHHEAVEELVAEAGRIATAAAAAPVTARLDELSAGLTTVTEVVTGLEIADATVRTTVLERVAEALGGVNRARAVLAARRRTLLDQEGRAEFAAEFALLGQTAGGALSAVDTPQDCEDQLARVLARLEDLESRFAGHDDFLARLDDKRAELHEAFTARRQALADARARRAEQLTASAERVLGTVSRRAAELADADAVAAYFASDPMVAKVRRTAEELRALEETVRAGELDGRLETARQEAARALRDRTDLYTDGGRTLRLGAHRFAVTTQPPQLTLVPHGDGLAFTVTGTDYRAPLAATAPDQADALLLADRQLASESPRVGRAEHLAARVLAAHGPAALAAHQDLTGPVREIARRDYEDGYERGVHDHDAALILAALLPLHEKAGLLRHEPSARADAQLFWAHAAGEEERGTWTRRARSLARAGATFGAPGVLDALRTELAEAIGARPVLTGVREAAAPEAVAAYLLDELTTGPDGFTLAAGVHALLEGFRHATAGTGYADDLAALTGPAARHQLAETWIAAYAAAQGAALTPGDLAEAVAVELTRDRLTHHVAEAVLTTTIDGLLAAHPRVTDGSLTLRLDEFLARTTRFAAHEVPAFRAAQRRRTALVADERARLRLDEFRPRVMDAFVRNRLVDEVYLPLVGDSLHKQLGGTGGLLLLISPPGYGKTTLMEYVADRLGLLLVKVSGPALGHAVTSLDPADAPDAAARREIEKINFALAAGNNTLLHLDDVQHTSPEFLQKFIPLCDATRRVEGVRDGEPRTFDLRGKRFAVCMTGNPYTESGGLFRIPDMLANRADVWNLGDVLTGKEDAFALSFVENALTANPVLAPLASRDRADLALLLRLASGDPTARADRLTRPLAPAELDRAVAVLRHLLTAREVVLAVNAEYIASAARSAETRTEPPFQLQGSYRNMNRIAQRLQPVMSDAEVETVIDDHYRAEAQTLTTGAEANLLRLSELRGRLTAEQADRLREIRAAYSRARALGGPESDPVTRAVAALGLLADRVAAIETALTRTHRDRDPAHGPHRDTAHDHARAYDRDRKETP
ncbi:DNA repair ATPase [Streptomyces abyssomicinicus]|uniref:DNA repair ATPase n=1 Tax=Streptomyces abyssomicinicus TaxID=574929 RepID=UPI0012507928|nr:DNA repair ATPase [Streptomyces abyssomicinicus]